MTIQLRLDATALNALFPEGSEARLELQSAVVAEFSKKHLFNGVSKSVQMQIEVAKRAAISEVLRDVSGNRLGIDADQLSLAFGNRLRQGARDAVDDAMKAVLHDHVKACTDQVLTELRGEITRQVQARTDEEIKKAVTARFQNALDAMK